LDLWLSRGGLDAARTEAGSGGEHASTHQHGSTIELVHGHDLQGRERGGWPGGPPVASIGDGPFL